MGLSVYMSLYGSTYIRNYMGLLVDMFVCTYVRMRVHYHHVSYQGQSQPPVTVATLQYNMLYCAFSPP